MCIRDSLTGGYITGVRQIGFDRAMEIALVSSDELGYSSEKYLICEIMGTYSNFILLYKDKHVMAVLQDVYKRQDYKKIYLSASDCSAGTSLYGNDGLDNASVFCLDFIFRSVSNSNILDIAEYTFSCTTGSLA